MIKKKNLAFIVTLVSLVITIILLGLITTNAATDSPTANGRYYIKNVATGKYLNVSGNSSSSGTNVNIFSKDKSYPRGQVFKLIANNGYYMLKPDCSSCVLNVASSNSANGVNVNIYTKSGSKTQTWSIRSVTGGYKITSMGNHNYDYTGYVLNATGNTNSSNVNIKTGTEKNNYQIWTLEKVTDKQLLLDNLNSRVGRSYPDGYCAKFIWETYYNLYGYANPGYCCAHKYKTVYRDSTSKDIPVGATVFFDNPNSTCNICGYNRGHIGFYVGNGYMIHASGGTIQKTHIWNSSYWTQYYDGWGWYRDKTL